MPRFQRIRGMKEHHMLISSARTQRMVRRAAFLQSRCIRRIRTIHWFGRLTVCSTFFALIDFKRSIIAKRRRLWLCMRLENTRVATRNELIFIRLMGYTILGNLQLNSRDGTPLLTTAFKVTTVVFVVAQIVLCPLVIRRFSAMERRTACKPSNRRSMPAFF